MDGIAPGDGRRLPVIGFLEPGRGADLAGRVDADNCAFERPYPGPLDIAADAEPEMAALGPRLGLPPAECLDPAHCGERLVESAGVIAAVVDDRLAVAIDHAGR